MTAHRPRRIQADYGIDGPGAVAGLLIAGGLCLAAAGGMLWSSIVSSLVLHNIHGRAERDTAVREIVRVLKPGGRVALLDAAHTKAYAQVLIDSGMADVRRSRPQLLFFAPARIVTGQKPSPSGG